MEKATKDIANYKFFAAANGYEGFRSYFDSVFDPYQYDRIFILKGGPGTGKSSFMKTIAEEATAKGIRTEAIFCSSDPASLDGAIFNERMAIIDGTAPHEREPRLPGAVDEIINLGDYWNEGALIANHTKIEKLCLEKTQKYKSAYNYLGFCKNIDCYIHKKLKTIFNFEETEKAIEEVLSGISVDSYPKEAVRLISSFGKSGYKRFSTLEEQGFTTFNVKGEFEEITYIFINALYLRARKLFDLTRFPTPYSDQSLEALLLKNKAVAFISNANVGTEIDAQKFFATDKALKDELTELEQLKKVILRKAQAFFAAAFDIHSELEKIYTESMDFSTLLAKREEVKNKILNFCLREI